LRIPGCDSKVSRSPSNVATVHVQSPNTGSSQGPKGVDLALVEAETVYPTPTERDALKPLFRWPGGKRWLVDRLLELLPPNLEGRYFEPFVGGGALFFAYQPERSVIADSNHDLMNSYRVLRDSPAELADLLASWSTDEETYYRVRAEDPADSLHRAARFIYLTTLAFNGIYRVNLGGKFNVPYGHRSYQLGSGDLFARYSRALKRAEILTADFSDVLALPTPGDVVYLDPPYTVAHANNGFVKYNDRLFLWADQERLAADARRLAEAGVSVIVSNAFHTSIAALYPGFRHIEITRTSVMAAAAGRRGPIKEYVLTNVG
jgi:DNA adenine methylase